MEQYYEQNVINHEMDKISNRTRTLSILRLVCFGLSVAILFFGATMLKIYWVFVIAAIPSFAIGLVIGHFNKRANTEYDYVLDNDQISVAAIYYRARRKLKYKIDLRTVESVGAYGSEGYKRNAETVKKKQLALVNFDDEKAVLYIVYNTDKGRFMIFLEPDRTFMLTLRRVVSAIKLFDSSVSDLEKHLSAKQAEIIAAATKKSTMVDTDEAESVGGEELGDSDQDADTDATEDGE